MVAICLKIGGSKSMELVSYTMIDVTSAEPSQYDIICSEEDFEYSMKLFVLHSEEVDGVFVGFGSGYTPDKVMPMKKFVRVDQAGEYDGVMQSYCDYCDEFNQHKLPSSKQQPSLGACYGCHNHILSELEEMIEENCPEVISTHI
jgi:hypothetical protein